MVIAIIGILATISVIALSNARAKSRDAKRAGDMKQVQTALELFFNDQNRYPTAEEWNTGQIYYYWFDYYLYANNPYRAYSSWWRLFGS